MERKEDLQIEILSQDRLLEKVCNFRGTLNV